MSIYSQLTSKDEEEKKKQQGMRPSQIAAEENKPKVSLYQQLTAKTPEPTPEPKKPSLFENIKSGVSDFFSKVSGKKKAEEVFGGSEPTKLLETKTTVPESVNILPKNIFDTQMDLTRESGESAKLTPEAQAKVSKDIEVNFNKLKTVEEKSKAALVEISQRTSGTGIVATIKSASPNVTFKQAYEVARKSQEENNDTLPEQFLTGLKDTLPQTALGIALGFVPLVGPGLTTSYWAAVSAGSEIEEKGYATPTNVAIDVVGDRMLGGMMEKLFKTPAKSLIKIVKKAFVVEGGTEVAQDLLKFGNDYRMAKTEEERGGIIDQAKQYFTSGQILVTLGVGGVSGAGIATVATGIEKITNRVEMTPEAAIETVQLSDLKGTDAGNTIIAKAYQAQKEGKMVVMDPNIIDKNTVVTPDGNKVSVNVSERETIIPKVTEEKQVTSPEALKQTEKTTPVLTEVDKQKQLVEQKLKVLEGVKVGPEGETIAKKIEVKPLTEEIRKQFVQVAKESGDAKSFLNKIGKQGAAEIRAGGDTVVNFFNQSNKETATKVEDNILPKDVSISDESKKTGAKRISPDRIPHQQTTPEAGIESLVEKVKNTSDKNAGSWMKVADKVQALIDKYGESMPMRTEANLKKYPSLADDFYSYAQLKKNAFKPKNLTDMKGQFVRNSERTKWTPEKEKDYRTRVNKQYIDLVKEDISRGYKFPDKVLNYDKSFKTAVNNRERYEKGLRTSFSSDDSRIVFDNVDQIGAGMKRQDGKPITEYQKREITNGVIDFANAMKLDMKNLAKDDRWVYVHLSGTNPFLMSGIAGLYRTGKDNISISVGGREFFYKIVDGKKVKEYITPTVSHELGHAIDYKTNRKLIDPSLVNKLKYNYNEGDFAYLEAKYYRDPAEVVARMVEQYVSVAQGSEAFYDQDAYWNKDIFDNQIKPAIKKGLNEQFAEYRTDKTIDRIKPPEIKPVVTEEIASARPVETKVAIVEKTVEPIKKKPTLKRKVNLAKNVTSIKSALRSVRKQFSELVSEAEGTMAVAKEQREGLNTKDIAKLKLAYNRSQRFQEGDIETMRDSKYQPLVDRVVEDVQIKYPDLNEEEAFDFALNLPTKADATFIKSEDMAKLMDRQKVLQGYLNILEAKQAKITGQQMIEEGNAVFDEWRSVMDQQEKLTRLITAQERQSAVQKPVEEAPGTPKLSRVAERVLNQLINVQESDITYKPLSIVEDAAKATEFSLQNPEIALRVAKGLELPPSDITETAISIAVAERARRDGDFDLYSKLIASRTLRQTRRGQEIVVERGRMDENSSEYFMKQLLAERARIVESGKKWKYAIEKKAAKIQNIIKEETTKLKQTIDKKVLTKLESAQKLIDSLTCKI